MINKKMKQKKEIILISISIFLILTLSTIISAETTKDIDYFTDLENLQEFQSLSQENKNTLWQQDSENALVTFKKNIIVEKLAEKISTEKYVDDINTGRMKLIAKTWIDAYFENKGVLPETQGIQLQGIESYEDIKKIVKSNIGVDLDIQLHTVIEELKGFGSKDLQWSDETTIGNGNTWLNLEKLPQGINKIEYDEKQKTFILKFKTGGELILGKGSTNEDGSLKFFSKLPDRGLDKIKEIITKVKNTEKLNPEELLKELSELQGFNLKEIILKDILGELQGNPYGIENFQMLGKNGQIIITEKGFQIKGDDAQIKYGNFLFNRKSGESAESTVEFLEDRLVLTGTEFTRMGYVTTDSTTDKFTVHFGDLDRLAKIASFEDRKITTTIEANPFGVMEPDKKSVKSLGQIYFQFDDKGKLTHIAKQQLDEQGRKTYSSPEYLEWVPLDPLILSYANNELTKITDTSGTTVKDIISQARKGQTITFEDIKEKFYKTPLLTIEAENINVYSYQKDFLNMNGENLVVGGKGGAEVLKNFNSLTYTEGNGFEIRNKDLIMQFKKDSIYSNVNLPGIDEVFEIGKVYQIGLGDPEKEFVVSQNNPSGKVIEKSKTFTAGRETRLSLYGASADTSIEVPVEDLDKIKQYVGEDGGGLIETSRNKLTKIMMEETGFSLKYDVFLPVQNLEVSIKNDKEKAMEFLDTALFERLKDQIIPKEIFQELPIKEEERKIKEKTIEDLRTITRSIIPEKINLESGTFGFEIKNNPHGTPTLILTNNQKEIGSIQSNTETSYIFKTILEGALRTPEFEKGQIIELDFIRDIIGPNTIISGIKNPNQAQTLLNALNEAKKSNPTLKDQMNIHSIRSFYATRKSLKRLWYENLRKGDKKYDNTASGDDLLFTIKTLNQYTEPTNKQ